MFRFACSEHKVSLIERTPTEVCPDYRKGAKCNASSRVFIVCSYLIANVLNLVITAWEYISPESTQSEEYYDIYEIMTDIVSVLSFSLVPRDFKLRFSSCNKEIRDMVKLYLCGLTAGENRPKKDTLSRTRKDQQTPVGHHLIALLWRWREGRCWVSIKIYQ
ncbi:unnamed protein product, partial [Mesorhabditis belari]|uniref:Uncharacterized protein n=1 Tax=Mesorhabditis belari TaxID=2138241 RepID=A0AAF3ERA5_9BILA